jgi:predicted dehydrogenase
MLKVGIVGCGKIADSHVEQIMKIQRCEIVGVCDKEELMAKQLHDRFNIKKYFNNIDQMINEARPDVVHITTPPQFHFEIGKQCLESGCHIYVEKPFTINTREAQQLILIADKNSKKLTVGHDAQFSHAARRMRKMVREGYLGGTPVHLESSWGYDLGNAVYAKTLLSDKHHWTRTLPGGLLHNIINHGIAKIVEFLSSDSPSVIAYGFVSPFLKKLGEKNIIDELRVIISEEKGTTAYFTFSSQIRPLLYEFKIYGPKNGLMLNENQQILLKLRGEMYKSYAENFIPPLINARQYIQNFIHNTKLFLKANFHVDTGKKNLIELFYKSIRYNSNAH